MKIAIPNDNGQVNQHFGRSKEFMIIEMENQKVKSTKSVSTEQVAHNHEGLVGLMKDNNVEAVILGGIGPKAVQAFEQVGLKLITGITGEMNVVAEAYARGELVSRNVACDHSHGHSHDHEHGHGDGCKGGCSH